MSLVQEQVLNNGSLCPHWQHCQSSPTLPGVLTYHSPGYGLKEYWERMLSFRRYCNGYSHEYVVGKRPKDE